MRMIMIFALLSALRLHAADAMADGWGSIIRSDGVQIALSGEGLYFSADGIEYGQIDSSGLIRTIKDPYSSGLSLRPRALQQAFNGSRTGAVLTLGPLSAGISLNDRLAVFAHASLPYAEGAILYAHPGEAQDDLIREPMTEEDAHVLYMAAGAGYSIFRAAGILSYSDKDGISLFAGAGVSWESYSLVLMGGDPVSLYGDDEPQLWGIKGSFGEDGFMCSFSFSAGTPPVFSDDFMPYRAHVRSELDICGIRIYSSMSYSFSRKGRSAKSDYATISFDGFKIGYDSDNGLIASYEYDNFEIGIEGGDCYIELDLEFGDDAAVSMKLRSDGLLEAGISIVL